MKKHNIYIGCLFILISLLSCEKVFDDTELSMKRTNYDGTELRTDGYYFYQKADKFHPLFISRNGVFIRGYTYELSSADQVEESFKNGVFYENIKNDKTRWGVFNITEKAIEFEGWAPNGGLKHTTSIEYGEIIDDTTFCIYKEHIYGNDEERNSLYHFKQFSPKPDSTNSFIK